MEYIFRLRFRLFEESFPDLGENSASLREAVVEVVWLSGGGGISQIPDLRRNDCFDDTYFFNGEPSALKGYCTDVWFDPVERFISDNRDRPFFCCISTNAPHSPYNAERRCHRWDRRRDQMSGSTSVDDRHESVRPAIAPGHSCERSSRPLRSPIAQRNPAAPHR